MNPINTKPFELPPDAAWLSEFISSMYFTMWQTAKLLLYKLLAARQELVAQLQS
jgi:hypothetical protein